jgi:hypothetical protein
LSAHYGADDDFSCAAVWFSNAWNTAYMPINSNHTFDNMGKRFNVTKILTDSRLDNEKYQAYSQPWISAGYATSFTWYFIMYGACMSPFTTRHARLVADFSSHLLYCHLPPKADHQRLQDDFQERHANYASQGLR